MSKNREAVDGRVLQKWNHQKRDYEQYVVPEDWKVSLYSSDMDKLINCPHCGKTIKFGDGYTSKEIHNHMGFGYSVCEKCHEEELKRELKWRRT